MNIPSNKPTETPTKEKWSRPAKRELKKLNDVLRKLVISFLEFRLKQTDKEGEIVANKFAQCERVYIVECNKKYKYIKPDRLAFAKSVDKILVSERRKAIK